MDFSPDGSFFVIVATGFIPAAGDEGHGHLRRHSRFDDGPQPGPALIPTWMNYTGGDTLHSVVVTDTPRSTSRATSAG